jgi:long-chain acyl-CoA synthetase
MTLTFGQATSKAGAIAHTLRQAGLKMGDAVAIATSRGSGFYACFAACYYSGFPVAIIDPAAGNRELGLLLQKAAPSAVIADDEVLQRLMDGMTQILPRHVWRLSMLYDVNGPDLAPVSLSRRGDLPAYMIFTSGTTSDPKAVVVSRRALQYHVATLARVFDYDSEARLLHYLPTHHTDGLVHGVAASLLTGMAVVHPGAFTVSVNLKETLRANKITHFLAVPAMLSMISRAYGDCEELFQYDGFRRLISTAGFLDRKFWQDFQDFFGVRVSNFYGLTETVSGSLYCGPDNETYRLGTVGKPIDARAQIVDEEGSAVPVEEIGELQVSGPHLMSGYLNDPAATRATMANGWFSTGDLFFQDGDGFYHFVGRKKNIIKRGGITVCPEDIRRVLVEMPAVVDAEVIGLPDEMFEEVIVVCAVVQDGVDADDIRTLCRHELAPERRPDRVVLLDNLPRGPSGKVQRNALVAMLQQTGPVVTGSDSSLRSRVMELAADVFATDCNALDDRSSPATVDNWDSYAGMEFVLALEQEFDLRLQAIDIMKIGSVGDALEVVSAALESGDNGSN